MSLKYVKNYINGEWVESENTGYIDIENSSTGQVIGKTPLSTVAEANRSIDAAAKAFIQWSRTPASRRVQPIHKLFELLRDNEEKNARVLVEEIGKSLPDAHAELRKLFEKR